MVKRGTFHADLYYQLGVVEVVSQSSPDRCATAAMGHA